MKKNILSAISLGLIVFISSGNAFANMPLTNSTVGLKTTMRMLWEDHIVYTRNYIISDLGNLGDKSKIAERLLKNQIDIGDAIKPIYGNDAGNKLTVLLRDHILIATKVVTAAKENQDKDLAKASDDWKKNGEEIAVFLSSANPNWKKSEMKEMLAMHLTFTTTEVVSRLKKNWDKDIEAYDRGHAHMLIFADALTSGIVKQFPEKFRN